MMMSSTAAGSVSSRWPERWAASAPLAGYWASTTPPTTDGDGSWGVSGPNCCGRGERRQPRMPNAISPMVDQRILALALAYPGWGPDRLSLELAREKWGGLKVSANGTLRGLKRT